MSQRGRAVPVAHDQRRGGVGVLRRRHGAVPHQRGDRVRPQALPRRHRRRRLPRRRGRGDPRRDGAPVGGPRLLREQRRAQAFHIHGVTGPDEYTTVVNDNLYTNVMARFNLRYAARTVELLREWNPEAYERLVRRRRARPGRGRRGGTPPPTRCSSRTTRSSASTPRTTSFLDLEPWDFEGTPPDKYPLLLHFHPLVIYRHQVLKQADVVLAMFLRSRAVHARAEATQLRLLRPDHHRRLVAVGVRAGDRGGPDRLRRARARLLPPGAVRRPRRHARQHRRRRAHRVGGRGVGRARLRVRRDVRQRRGAAVRAAAAAGLGRLLVPDPTTRQRACTSISTTTAAWSPCSTVRRCRSPTTTMPSASRPASSHRVRSRCVRRVPGEPHPDDMDDV